MLQQNIGSLGILRFIMINFNRYFIFYAQIFCVMGLTFLIGLHNALALGIEDVRIGTHPDKTRIVLDLDQNTTFKAFALNDPYRIVIDLPEFQWRAGSFDNPPKTLVSGLRQGLNKPGLSRIVIDLQSPASIQSAFILPAQNNDKERLVIDIKAISAAAFAQEKDRIFGTLDTENKSPTGKNVSSTIQASEQKSPQNFKQASTFKLPDTNSTGFPLPKPKPPYATKKPIIVIDPGHGGVDPGAIGANNVKEKDVTFATAMELKRQLEATGLYDVKLTRNKDIYLKLHERVNIARKHKADLFVSIHADSINKPDVRGASIYTLSDTASDKQTARLAARENKADLIAGIDLSHEDRDVKNILIDLAMRDTMNQSKFFANTLVKTIEARGIKLLTRPHRFAGFAVLKAPDIPSVLIELGFMSNKKEAEMLTRPDYRRKVAGSLVDGINQYFAKVRKNGGS